MDDKPKHRSRNPWVFIRSAFRLFLAGIILSVSVLVILVLTLFLSPFQLDPFLRWFCRGMNFATGIKVRAHGLENLDPKKTYLYLFNHINMFDHFTIFPFLPNKMRGVEKEVHFKWPIYGTLIRKIGQIPIPPRGSTTRALASLERAQEMMKKGVSIGMAPEGTRSATGELQRFKKGAFHVAVQMQATIAPIVLVGMHKINQKGDWLLYPGTIDIYFEEPFSAEGLNDKDVRALTERTRNIFVSRLASAESSTESD